MMLAGCSKRRPSHPPNPGAPRRALSQARPQASRNRRRYRPRSVGPFTRTMDLGERKTPLAFSTSENLNRYVEDFDESRTKLAACFNILRLSHMRWDPQPQPLQILPAGSRNYRIAHKPALPSDRNNYGSSETGLAVRLLAG